MTAPSPSGAQWLISHGDQRAIVVEVGGGLRTYDVGETPVVAGYVTEQMCAHGRGQVLLPWPNRIRDGRYHLGGADQQLPISEVARHNASHGLVRWVNWELVAQTADSVEVRYRLHPQPGWPWYLDLGLVYRLGPEGLTVRVHAHNPGEEPVPFGFAAHPYVATGGAAPGDVTLTLPAESYLTVDPERLLPLASVPVEGTAYDFRTGGALGAVGLDTAYTDFARDGERWRITVDGVPAGRVEVWGSQELPWAQVFDEKVTLPLDGPYPPGIAIEPMSCPADAFNSGTDLAWIAPGSSWAAEWGITAHLRA